MADDAELLGKALQLVYQGHFIDYPLKLNATTLRKLGMPYTMAVIASCLKAQARPRLTLLFSAAECVQ